ncbi:MAG: hypothetical protein ACI9R3_003900 [Verrucomicrobiales bacterium]
MLLSLDVSSIGHSSEEVKLTDEQKQTISQWADEAGISMGEVQKRLKNELNISVTYLETRFLLEDHAIELKKEEPPAADPEEKSEGDDLAEVEAVLGDDGVNDPPLPGGNVTVTVDSVTQPQAMVSGRVIFSDGERAAWNVDQMGRLGLDPTTPGYRPSEGDIATFQNELQRAMEAS